MEILWITIVLSFFLALIFIPKWIQKTKQAGLLWEDMNKFSKPKNIAFSGGIIVVFSFLLGSLSYIAIRTFIIKSTEINLEIFALLLSISILALIGLTDDILGWKNRGLSMRFRLFLALFASIPLIVINAGTQEVVIPFLGEISFGLFYTLIVIPVGIVGATTTYNFLAGFNGLEASQGIIILTFLSFVAYQTNSSWLSIIGICMVASLLAFYLFNKTPALIFPGDTLTYSVGGLIAIMAILGNFERIAVFIFIPYIIETFLKIRGKLKKQSFGKPNQDGSLDMPYEKIYGLTHLSIFILKKFKKKVYEKEVVYLINLFQIIIILLALIIFKGRILG